MIYQYKRLYVAVETGIYECNVNCRCSTKCSNRVAQLRVAHNFEVFMTENCGWGVRCRNDLPRGAFICCYFGELQTEELSIETARNHGDDYMATLNFIEFAENIKDGYESEPIECTHSESDCDTAPPRKRQRVTCGSREIYCDCNESDGVSRVASSQSIKYFPLTRQFFGPNETEYLIDGKRFGNVGRFFNVRLCCDQCRFSILFSFQSFQHSCEPNVFMQNVFIDTHDIRFPTLAFFTMRNVQAGTELRFDYNYNVGSIPTRVMYCKCRTKKCRGRLL